MRREERKNQSPYYGGKIDIIPFDGHRLDPLADGKPGAGQGGRVMLSVQDIPKEVDPDYETWLKDWQILQEQAERAGFASIWVPQVPNDFDAMTAITLMSSRSTPRFPSGHPTRGRITT